METLHHQRYIGLSLEAEVEVKLLILDRCAEAVVNFGDRREAHGDTVVSVDLAIVVAILVGLILVLEVTRGDGDVAKCTLGVVVNICLVDIVAIRVIAP